MHTFGTNTFLAHKSHDRQAHVVRCAHGRLLPYWQGPRPASHDPSDVTEPGGGLSMQACGEARRLVTT